MKQKKQQKRQFTAVYIKRGKWFLGWVEEVPGVNTQGKTLKEVKENLQEALEMIIETNRELLAKDLLKIKAIREPILATVC